jgi:hypothetical protein
MSAFLIRTIITLSKNDLGGVMSEDCGYGSEHEDMMRLYCASLPEDHRRRYAAIEALKLGRGGIAYVARVLGMSRRTIHTGIRELNEMDASGRWPPQRPSGDAARVRRTGGGRPKATQRQPGLKENCEAILEAHGAGSPTDPRVRWTDLNPGRLAAELLRRGFDVGRNTAARLLRQAGYRRLALRKELITGHVDPEERDRQFHHIDALRRRAQAAGNPVLCVDTKKKELLGSLHRPGQCYSTDVQSVYDHDFRHLAEGKLIPHGVYDYFANRAFMTLGTSCETSAFVCDAIDSAWRHDIRARYPRATEIVLTFDAGGANAARSLRFKEDLIDLSARLGLPLRIAHYPPYTSKWHPIEHRVFCHVEQALRGVILDCPETALHAIERVTTQTGLSVTGNILDKVYAIGRKCSKRFREIKEDFIRHDAVLGKWNYLVDARGLSPASV